MATRKKRRRNGRRPSSDAPAARPASPDQARAPDPAAPAPPAAPPRGRRARLDEAPKAPWSPFPLVELTILGGIILLILGLVGVASDGPTFIFCGLALVGVATLELSLREHFAGYRSHSSLLAGAAVVLVVASLAFFTDLPELVLIIVGVVVFGVCFLLLRSAFQRRTGGLGFRA
jgi:hypothetical protein